MQSADKTIQLDIVDTADLKRGQLRLTSDFEGNSQGSKCLDHYNVLLIYNIFYN